MATKLKIFTVLFRNRLPVPILENPSPTVSPGSHIPGYPRFCAVISEFCVDVLPVQEADGTFSVSCLLTSVRGSARLRAPGKVEAPSWAQRDPEMLTHVLPVDSRLLQDLGRAQPCRVAFADVLDLAKGC